MSPKLMALQEVIDPGDATLLQLEGITARLGEGLARRSCLSKQAPKHKVEEPSNRRSGVQLRPPDPYTKWRRMHRSAEPNLRCAIL